jgi:hypothetical protein
MEACSGQPPEFDGIVSVASETQTLQQVTAGVPPEDRLACLPRAHENTEMRVNSSHVALLSQGRYQSPGQFNSKCTKTWIVSVTHSYQFVRNMIKSRVWQGSSPT